MRPTTAILLLIAAFAAGPTGCMTSLAREDANAEIALPEGISPELVAQAKRMMTIVAREIDKPHVEAYDLPDPTPGDDTLTNEDLGSMFVDAVIREYGDHRDEHGQPSLLRERLKALASQVMFSAPEVTTDPTVGNWTPFHGMNEGAFAGLMANEDIVFNHHMSVNGGSPNGVRPFSVCETGYIIKIAKGELHDQSWISTSDGIGDSGTQIQVNTINNYDEYAKAYQSYSTSCAPADLTEWYDFRGLGALRPTWLESNISDRFLGSMQGECNNPTAGQSAECAAWDADRLGYRDRKNTELTLREVFYDARPEALVGGSSWGGTQSMEQYILNPGNTMALVEDRTGDGIGEMIAPGTLRASAGARAWIGTSATFALPSEQAVTLKNNTTLIRQDNSEHVALTKGTRLKIAAGIQVAFAAKMEYPLAQPGPINLNAGKYLRLPGGTSLQLEDGTPVRVAGEGEVEGAGKSIDVKLTSAISLPVASEGWTPSVDFTKVSSGILAGNNFAYEFTIAIPLTSGGSVRASMNAQDVGAYDGVDPAWNRSFLDADDLGMMTIFSDGAGCSGDHPSPDTCPLLRRFYAIIDRHETFYQTYSSVHPDASNISQQPSPLVACSITLGASHAWDHAGEMRGGRAGFIYLMRIPFNEILVGDTRSIDTLGLLRDANGDGSPDNDLHAGPRVLTVQELYQHTEQLDMSKVWLDVATLSHNAFQSEHEVSKFGSVPAEQIEGILVIRRPASLGDTTTTAQ